MENRHLPAPNTSDATDSDGERRDAPPDQVDPAEEKELNAVSKARAFVIHRFKHSPKSMEKLR